MVLTIKKQPNGTVFDEEDLELSYGPGIVSKLRCRYMNLTLKDPNPKIRQPVFEFRKGIENSHSHDNIKVTLPTHIARNQNNFGDVHLTSTFSYKPAPRNYSLNRSLSTDTVAVTKTIVESELPPTNVVKSKLQIFEPLNIKLIAPPVTKQNNIKSISTYKSILPVQLENKDNGDIFTNLIIGDKRDASERTKTKQVAPNNENDRKDFTMHDAEVDVVTQTSSEVTKRDTRLQDTVLDNNFDQNTRLVKKNVDNSTIVFNFTDRYNIPDYVSFQNVSDAFTFSNTMIDMSMLDKGCAAEKTRFKFLNSNIIIDGKSCMKSKTKSLKFKISFNDSLTSVFEYPSEDSFLEDSEQKSC